MPTTNHVEGLDGIWRANQKGHNYEINRLDIPKVAAPGRSVQVSLPALMMSLGRWMRAGQKTNTAVTHGSTWSCVGYGPIPRIPFSLSSQTLTEGSKCSGTSVGIPTPKFT